MNFKQAKHFRTDTRTDIDLVVIHTMEYPERASAAEWCTDFFTDPRSPKGPVVASCHYAVDNDSVTQCVHEKDVAWHTPGSIGGRNVNDFSIGIEHAGYASQTAAEWADAYSLSMLERSAELVGDICRRRDIPVRRLTIDELKAGNIRGITGHVDCTKATGTGSHWDPGPNFPWTWYIERVREHAKAPNTSPTPPPASPSIIVPDNVVVSLSDRSQLVRVEVDGVVWLVAPTYVAPIGIAEAKALAERLGYELPTPALVDAIWRAADLRVSPALTIQTHDGSGIGMNAPEVYARVLRGLEEAIGERGLGAAFRLLAGGFKDVIDVDGRLGLYGLHVEDVATFNVDLKKRIGVTVPTNAPATPGLGRVVQQPYFNHLPGWKDYLQGCRLCVRA
jgi:N-acetyl-anhydromuramyl-L-alanine amidase AmpD